MDVCTNGEYTISKEIYGSMDNKLFRFIEGRKQVTYGDLKILFLKKEPTLIPALDIEIDRLKSKGLIKHTKAPIKDFDHFYISSKGYMLARLLKERDKIDNKIGKLI